VRISAIAGLTEPVLVAPALIAAHVGARAVLPFVMYLLPAARTDGLAFAAGVPSGVGVAIAAALGFLALLLCLGLAHALIALVVLAIAVALLCWLAMRQIGGQTGDVLGAVEQVSEIVILLVALR
jgi:adenosylcobinamide-GDP ribazoletransferase